MDNKKTFSALLILSSVLLMPLNIYPQEAEEPAQIVLSEIQSENAAENKIKQPFSWENMGDVLKYEILIERYDEKTQSYVQHFFHETTPEETEACLIYINPILPPGNYRSQIKVFNILGILEEDLTAYDNFTVRRAYNPEVTNVNYPLYMISALYLDDIDNDGIIEVTGKNLFISDETNQSLEFTNYYLKNEKRIIYPEKIIDHDDKNNKKITLQFNMKEMESGEYHLIAQDASGLHSEENPESHFTIKFKKLIDFDVEAGYVCPIILHNTENIVTDQLGSPALPLSAQIKLTFIPFKHSWGYLGFASSTFFSHFEYEKNKTIFNGNIINSNFLVVYQTAMLKRRLFLDFHAGAGIILFNNLLFSANIPDIGIVPYRETLNTLSLSFTAGASAMYYFNKRFYCEAGLDYVFVNNNKGSLIMGFLLPSLGAGWQF